MPIVPSVSPKVFVDTNVFIYAQDAREPQKQQKAINLIDELSKANRLVISTQVLNEICSVLFKLKPEFVNDHTELSMIVDELYATTEVVYPTAQTIKTALLGVTLHRMSWFDSLIWASAKLEGCAILYSEDFQDGRIIDDVKITNPFNDSEIG